MADNVLKAIVEIEAKGVGTSLNQVNTAITKTETGFKKLTPASNQATLALSNLGRVAQDAPYGFIGIANNLNPLLESFQRLKATTGTTGSALKSLAGSLIGPGGIGIALSVASSLLVVFGDKLFGASKAAKDTKTATDSAKDSAEEYANSIRSSIQGVAQEAARVEGLVGLIRNEASTRRERIDAIKELQRIAPDYFGTLDAEKISVEKLTIAYQGYINQLKRSVEAKVIEKQLSDVIDERLTLERKLGNADREKLRLGNKIVEVQKFYVDGTDQIYEDQKRLNELKKLEIDLARQLSFFIKPDSTTKPPPKPTKEKFRDTYEDPFKGGKLDFNFREPIRLAELAAKEYRETIKKELEIPIKPKVKIKLAATGTGLLDIDLKAMNDSLTASIEEFLGSTAVEGLSSVGEALGAALSGGNIGNVFAGFADAIAGGLQALGKQFIKVGVLAKLAKDSLKTLFTNPFAAIGVGVALVAAGAALKGALGKGITGARALGGPVGSGGSYIVGERGPELFTPNVNGSIIPNGRMGSYGGGSLGGQVQFVISGNNLIGVLSSAGRNQRRLV